MWARRNQLLDDHLLNVANLCSYFLEHTQLKDCGYVCGLIHDLGKSTHFWQNYLQESIYKEDIGKLPGSKIDHSSIAAQYITKNCDNWAIARIISYVVAGHHSGLLNFDGNPSLKNRLSKDLDDTILTPNVNNFTVGKIKKPSPFTPQFMIRILFSCLIDADRIDSSKKYYQSNYSIEDIYDKFFNSLNSIPKSENNELNQYRNEILNKCIEKSKSSNGFFNLTSPTGSGKTLSSTAFGLNHVKHNKQNRLIYIVPFLSITEQNAQVLRDFTYDDAILEHHSNFDYSKYDNADVENIILKSENWNENIIVTTFVEFFESLYSNKPSKCRKNHNIINSTIIIDEVQQISLEYLKPCISVLKELVDNYNCSVLFCTATQPSLHKSKILSQGIEHITYILDNPNYYFNKFKRVQINYVGKISNEELISMLDDTKTELIVVNTKAEAKQLYNSIDNCYYLTTNLCPQHRRDVLSRIYKDLENEVPCKVISTSLIEAGVDISFNRVFRAITGIDSILQSAGRCNREGKQDNLGEVIVYFPENGLPKGKINVMGQITEKYLKLGYDITDLDVIDEYFKELYNKYQHKLDNKNILQRLTSGNKYLEFPFQDVSNDFKIIDQNTYSIIVPYNNESKKMIEEIENFSNRQLQKYSVQIPQYLFEKYYSEKILKKKKEGIYVLTKDRYYSNIGIQLNETKIQEYII